MILALYDDINIKLYDYNERLIEYTHTVINYNIRLSFDLQWQSISAHLYTRYVPTVLLVFRFFTYFPLSCYFSCRMLFCLLSPKYRFFRSKSYPHGRLAMDKWTFPTTSSISLYCLRVVTLGPYIRANGVNTEHRSGTAQCRLTPDRNWIVPLIAD